MAVKMVDRVTNSPSRIPVPLSCQGRSPNGKFHSQEHQETHKESFVKACFENGVLEKKISEVSEESSKKGKGFETFVMTGDMIIKTTSPHKSPKKSDSLKQVPYEEALDNLDTCIGSSDIHLISTEFNRIAVERKYVSDSNKETSRHNSFSGSATQKIIEKLPLGRVESAPVDNRDSGNSFLWSPATASPEDQSSSLKQTSSSSSEFWDQNGSTLEQISQPSHFDKHSKASLSNSDSTTSPEFPSDEKNSDTTTPTSSSDDVAKKTIVTSKSAEKIGASSSRGGHLLVRTSKSHENYLQSGADITLVDIDIDDDNMAYSLDALAYNESSGSSLEKIGEKDGPVSKSLQSSPERKPEKSSERVFMPGFISLDEPRVFKTKGKETKSKELIADFKLETVIDGANEDVMERSPGLDTEKISEEHAASREAADTQTSEIVQSILNSRIGAETDESDLMGDSYFNGMGSSTDLRDISDDSDVDSIHYQPSKSVDRPSAARLAKRLYHLDGFRKSDVSRHLSKKNDFSNLVAEEYLQFFDFTGNTLDVALRTFLKQFSLIGETQERERVLAHFSKRYMTCNPGSYNSEDACHTLTCAIMLLNTDLHGQNIGRKMTCSEFIENLSELNDGENFPKDVLKAIYQAIKNEPIEWAPDDESLENEPQVEERRNAAVTDMPPRLGHNPFLEVPDHTKTTEYKKGYVMRKCCMDPDGRKTSFGKRGWKMFYASLRDMILYLHKDEHGFKKGSIVESSNNAIRIHHAIATRATDYTKKQHVFRLQTSDWAEYLFQTSDSRELQEWMDVINFVAASLSAPPLPGGIGSQKKFQRPLMPSSYTKLNLPQQLNHHEERVSHLEREIHEHRAYPPEKGAKSRVIHEYLEKEHYLELELKRFKSYVYLLQSKLTTMHADLEPSLVESVIGEDDETAALPDSQAVDKYPKPVHRSLSDRMVYTNSTVLVESVESLVWEQYINPTTITTHL